MNSRVDVYGVEEAMLASEARGILEEHEQEERDKMAIQMTSNQQSQQSESKAAVQESKPSEEKKEP